MYGNYGLDELVKFVENIVKYPGTTKHPGDLIAQAESALRTFNANFQMPSKGNGDRCPVCGHKDGYNGWSNYETWEVALELSNDQSSNETCEELVRDAGSVADGATALRDYWSTYTDEVLANYRIENRWSGTGKSLELSDIPFSSLYTAAWSELNWYEIAASFKPDEWGDSDYAPEDDDEDSDD